MTILENTMSEVLLSDKDIIEKLTIRNYELEEINNNLNIFLDKYKIDSLDTIGVLLDEFQDFINKYGFENIKDLENYIEKKKNIINTYEKLFNEKNKKINLLEMKLYKINYSVKMEDYNEEILYQKGDKEIFFNIKYNINNIKSISNFPRDIKHYGNNNKFITYNNYELFPKSIKNINSINTNLYKEEKIINLPTPSISNESINSIISKKEDIKPKRIRARKPNLRDKNYEIKERLPITVFKNIKNNLVYKTIAAETSFRIKIAHEIAELTKRESNEINYNEIIDYIISQSNIKLDGKSKTRLRRKYQRSWEIYDIYGEKLNVLKFSIYVFSEIDDEDYKQWKIYLSEIIDTLPKQCNYIYRKGNKKGDICGIHDCKDHKYKS